MKTLIDHLGQYAEYHRDRRNIATHFVGIPMIVLAVAVLLSRPGFEAFGLWLSPAALVSLLSARFYFRLDGAYGLVMAMVLLLCLWVGAGLAVQSTALWLGVGLALFVVGWIIQFVGHHYEGRKPAFVDDLSGLIVGPLFVLAELGFLMGLRREVERAVEERAGPTCIREKKAAV
ncbi:Mpo1 family 2-hydroxy fatty acid dioxygenase [Metapseudomonas furukawaii]|uniref:Membrane protein n=1 Tax=Metapseudomonas furukawaii TaxID=1149133 RepID=A0AAD1FDD7_METFU|nr:Mpo1-like protein [Pseudomonas furukawaii]ELS27637.1 putative membrane protein [Pseudomonas furukawaii]BAU71819.1 membrane protein [Pseudomonas furukawaii]